MREWIERFHRELDKELHNVSKGGFSIKVSYANIIINSSVEREKESVDFNEFKRYIIERKYIDNDTVIVFEDGAWLERNTYDDDEWWEYKRTPTRREKIGDK